MEQIAKIIVLYLLFSCSEKEDIKIDRKTDALPNCQTGQYYNGTQCIKHQACLHGIKTPGDKNKNNVCFTATEKISIDFKSLANHFLKKHNIRLEKKTLSNHEEIHIYPNQKEKAPFELTKATVKVEKDDKGRKFFNLSLENGDFFKSFSLEKKIQKI